MSFVPRRRPSAAAWAYVTVCLMAGFWVKGVALAQGFLWTVVASLFPPIAWVIALTDFYNRAFSAT